MKLGFYADYSKKTIEFAQRVGFRSMEPSAWPESSLDADRITGKRIEEIVKDFEDHGIEISALGYYPNYLDPDRAKSAEAQRYFLKVIDLAQRMNVDTVCTFAGRDPYRSVPDNIPLFADVFSRFCEEAEKKNIKIAIENCPMMNQVSMHGLNIAFSPEIWDAMFAAVPSKALGLELDPSHLLWLGIDYVKAVYDYGDRIFHVHAKDMEIRRDVLARVGIYGQIFGEVSGFGHGWWRPRTPGWGEVDWPRFITALVEIDYKGNIDIEHEDGVFAKALALSGRIERESDIVANFGCEESGLILGYKTLSKLLP